MRSVVSSVLGKSVRRLIKIRGGSGSAYPGLLVERVDPGFLARTLGQLPHGVVLVSGTNGKTTTTKMVVELLEGQGLSVFTNRSGSNFTRGVVASLLSEVSLTGRLRADIAVLELDEAHAVHFVEAVKPRHALLLNVMRDQLDRFGEIDYTARLLASVAGQVTESLTLNREDSRIRAIAEQAGQGVRVGYFGLDPALLPAFPSDEALHGRDTDQAGKVQLPALVELAAFDAAGATFRMGEQEHTTALQLSGAYNIFNAAAAMATVLQVLGDRVDVPALLRTASQITPAFGRGEKITVDGTIVELVLVKNPAGFRLALSSFPPDGVDTMIAINDQYADGRDMSWLWDVDFTSLRPRGVEIVSGQRSYDMVLRLDYDEVPVGAIDTDLTRALDTLLARDPGTPKRIFTTYTAMLALRRHLGSKTTVKGIDE
ncbi:MAG: MurT ligase domain-containing protein [Dermabacter sp.]|nr:MurT ligase domain-containing protein [Dermabacter sp.]